MKLNTSKNRLCQHIIGWLSLFAWTVFSLEPFLLTCCEKPGKHFCIFDFRPKRPQNINVAHVPAIFQQMGDKTVEVAKAVGGKWRAAVNGRAESRQKRESADEMKNKFLRKILKKLLWRSLRENLKVEISFKLARERERERERES